MLPVWGKLTSKWFIVSTPLLSISHLIEVDVSRGDTGCTLTNNEEWTRRKCFVPIWVKVFWECLWRQRTAIPTRSWVEHWHRVAGLSQGTFLEEVVVICIVPNTRCLMWVRVHWHVLERNNALWVLERSDSKMINTINLIRTATILTLESIVAFLKSSTLGWASNRPFSPLWS